MTDRKRVLVTGMAGQIGGIIRRELGGRYELSGIDRVDVESVPMTVADIANLNEIVPAFEESMLLYTLERTLVHGLLGNRC